MTKLFFEADGCRGVTSGATGREYNADRSGFINVESKADIDCLTSGGYLVAGGLPKLKKYWVCDCGWEAAINSCPKCSRTDLTKIEK